MKEHEAQTEHMNALAKIMRQDKTALEQHQVQQVKVQEMEKDITKVVRGTKPYVAKNMEIVYVPLDLANEQYEEHLFDLGNWMSVPFSEQDRIQNLKLKYGFKTLPLIIVISTQSGEVILNNTRLDIF